MPERAERLKEYCQDRLGEGLRAVGYHSGDDVILLSMDKDVGRNFTTFIDDCRDAMR